MTKAVWNNQIIATSDQTKEIEGNQYFPKNSISQEFFESTSHSTSCPWKGKASYYTINVDGKQNVNAAWYYPEPLAAASEIKDYIAFWKGVEIISE